MGIGINQHARLKGRNVLLTLVSFVFVIGLIIFVHESGHFFVAKLFGMTPLVFSFGFGKRLFGINIGGTDCRVSLIPMGGYVQLEGEENESDDPKSFRKAPRWKRFIIYLAGPSMNFILAVGIYAGLFMTPHSVVTGTLTVKEVVVSSPSEKAGFVAGDEILTVDDRSVKTWEDFIISLQFGKTVPYQVEVKRNGRSLKLSVIPNFDKDEKRYKVGLLFDTKVETQQLSFVPAVDAGAGKVYKQTSMVLSYLGKVFTGNIDIKKAVGGPIKIAQVSGEAARAGFGTLLSLMAFLSLQIGILNLLPIMPIDGGHMAVLAVEGCIRRDLSLKAKAMVAGFGMYLLLILMILAVVNDLRGL